MTGRNSVMTFAAHGEMFADGVAGAGDGAGDDDVWIHSA